DLGLDVANELADLFGGHPRLFLLEASERAGLAVIDEPDLQGPAREKCCRYYGHEQGDILAEDPAASRAQRPWCRADWEAGLRVDRLTGHGWVVHPMALGCEGSQANDTVAPESRRRKPSCHICHLQRRSPAMKPQYPRRKAYSGASRLPAKTC